MTMAAEKSNTKTKRILLLLAQDSDDSDFAPLLDCRTEIVREVIAQQQEVHAMCDKYKPDVVLIDGRIVGRAGVITRWFNNGSHASN